MTRNGLALALVLLGADTALAQPPEPEAAEVEAVDWDRFSLHDSARAQADDLSAGDLDAFLASFEAERPDTTTRFGPDAEPLQQTDAPARNTLDVSTPKRPARERFKPEFGATLGVVRVGRHGPRAAVPGTGAALATAVTPR